MAQGCAATVAANRTDNDAMTGYWFFLSYARPGPYHDGLIQQFYEKLSHAVIAKAGLNPDLTPEEVGYWDQSSNRTGDEWRQRMHTALQTTRVLIAVYSQRFFTSECCGKELQGFTMRLEAQAKLSGDPPRGRILPVLWDPFRVPNPLPHGLQNIQFKDKALGDVYAQKGLSRLADLSEHEDDYRKFLDEFAERVVVAADSGELTSQYKLPPLDDIPNVFAPTGKKTKEDRKGIGESGPGVACFAFVAGVRTEMSGIRNDVAPYGSDDFRRDWRPYLGAITNSVGQICQRIASEESLFYENLEPGKDLVTFVRDAERRQNIVVFVVDPWSARIETYRQVLSEYDQALFSNTGVLVAWNYKDAETSRDRDKLHEIVGETFSRNIGLKMGYFRDDISTLEGLNKELKDTIHSVRKMIIQQGRTVRPVDNARSKPTLSGPTPARTHVVN